MIVIAPPESWSPVLGIRVVIAFGLFQVRKSLLKLSELYIGYCAL